MFQEHKLRENDIQVLSQLVDDVFEHGFKKPTSALDNKLANAVNGKKDTVNSAGECSRSNNTATKVSRYRSSQANRPIFSRWCLKYSLRILRQEGRKKSSQHRSIDFD